MIRLINIGILALAGLSIGAVVAAAWAANPLWIIAAVALMVAAVWANEKQWARLARIARLGR